jgi:hypothetical protein
MRYMKGSNMDRLCANCKVPVTEDGFGEVIHVEEIGDKDYPGPYSCYPLSALPRKNPQRDPRYALMAR